MKIIRPTGILAACALAAALPAGAEDLLQVYRDARNFDAQYAAARHALDAGREKLAQGRSLILPNVNLNANADASNVDSRSEDSSRVPNFNRDPRSYGATVQLTQPLFRRQNSLSYEQSEYAVKQAEASFGLASQDLIQRVSQAYFDVLSGQDNLALVRSQKTAVGEQLAQAKRNFEVGVATITDTHEAQARYDLIVAQEIAAQNNLANRERALQVIAGKAYAALNPLRQGVKLPPPTPNDMEHWVKLAETQSYQVQVQNAVVEIARFEALRGSAAHLPTLDAVASYGYLSQRDPAGLSAIGSDITTGQVGLRFALPLYQGGGISSREREAAALLERSRQELEAARRGASLLARQAFLAVVDGNAQIKALEQALVSSQSALDSNKLGYEVGVRINIDVLNAQQQVFQTRANLLSTFYNTLISHLRLKSAAGSLTEPDLEVINASLKH